ncbi:MAG TPA: acyltransferase [Magnetospirillum sp.]|nr:acyltransferase [Magnetospirillum sp.]
MTAGLGHILRHAVGHPAFGAVIGRQSLAARLDSCPHPSGFDYLRVILALGVVIVHASKVAGDQETLNFWRQDFALLNFSILPMFFCLSGFLVAGSFERSRTLTGFLVRRGLRIYPALIVEVLLSALILGPILTQLSLREYFSHADFYRYFSNTLGHIRYVLPGVFLQNPSPNVVNLSLWTVPYELACYLIFSFLAVIGAFRRSVILAASIGVLIYLALSPASLSPYLGDWVGGLLKQHYRLPTFFLSGVALYSIRKIIPFSLVLFCVCVAIHLYSTSYYMRNPQNSFASIASLSYITVYLGVFDPPRMPLILKGDYSYGIYLYAFPLQQLLATWPPARTSLAIAAGGIVLAALFAAFSWHCIEAPILARKARVARWAEDLVGRLMAQRGVLEWGRGK